MIVLTCWITVSEILVYAINCDYDVIECLNIISSIIHLAYAFIREKKMSTIRKWNSSWWILIGLPYLKKGEVGFMY